MNSQRFTPKKDQQIVEFYDAVGPGPVALELQRSIAEIEDRARFLKECGAWNSYSHAHHHLRRAMVLSGFLSPEMAALSEDNMHAPKLSIVKG